MFSLGWLAGFFGFILIFNFIPVHNSDRNEVCFRDQALWMHAKVPRHSTALSPVRAADLHCPHHCKYLFSA